MVGLDVFSQSFSVPSLFPLLNVASEDKPSLLNHSVLSVLLLNAAQAGPVSPFLSVCSFTVSVFYSSIIAAVYLLLRWIFYFNHYILGNLVLSGISPVCSGQYLFSLLRISATVSSGIRCLDISNLAKATSLQKNGQQLCRFFFSKTVFKSKTEITLTEKKEITHISCNVLCKFCNHLPPSSYPVILIPFCFFSRCLQTSSLT